MRTERVFWKQSIITYKQGCAISDKVAFQSDMSSFPFRCLGDLIQQKQVRLHTKRLGEVPSVLDDTEIASVFNIMSLKLC